MASANIDYPSNWIIQLPELNHDLAFTSIVQVLSSPKPESVPSYPHSNNHFS